jgi:hypothetical protein
VLDLDSRWKFQLPSEFHEARHRSAAIAISSNPKSAGTRIGGTSHGLMHSASRMGQSSMNGLTSVQAHRLASAAPAFWRTAGNAHVLLRAKQARSTRQLHQCRATIGRSISRVFPEKIAKSILAHS